MGAGLQKSRSYRDLEVWKLSIEFVKDMYVLTNKFPSTEVFALTNQIRRAAVSIPSNIAEGQSRNSIKEFKQFLSISLGSIAELETQLIVSNSIGYIDKEELNNFVDKVDRIRKMIKSLSRKIT